MTFTKPLNENASPCLPDEKLQQLLVSIPSTPAARFKSVVADLCRTDPVFALKLAKQMLVWERDDDQDTFSSDADPEEDTTVGKFPEVTPDSLLAPVAGKKRMRTRYAECEKCKEEVDLAEVELSPCQFHSGELEPAWDVDWDNPTMGDPHGDDMKEEYPEAYIWSCCQGRGDEEGCEENYNHTIQGVKRVKI